MHRGEEKFIRKLVGKSEGKMQLRTSHLGGSMILKCILYKMKGHRLDSSSSGQ
jgi:hypothetical protein